MNLPRTILFAGPSTFELERSLFDGLEVFPPAKRGDVERLVSDRTFGHGSTLLLADGIFHSHPSVGHVELRRAMTIGASVWGVSSMGAIRAAELRSVGMRGFGAVYERFVSDPDFRDDEVALLHGPNYPYHPLSEPLIHLRSSTKSLVQREIINEDQAASILHNRSSCWFGDRTRAKHVDELAKELECSRRDCEMHLGDYGPHRIKNQDLSAFLKARPWSVM